MGLLVVGILNWLFMLLWVAFALMVRAAVRQIELDPPTGGWAMSWVPMLGHMSPVTIALIALAMAGTGVFLIFAAIRMKRLQFEGGATAAGVLAMLIPPANLLGLPIGIWVLSVLGKAEVKAAFAGQKAQKEVSPQATGINAKEAARRRVRGPAIGLLIVCLVGLLTFAARGLFMSWLTGRTFLSTSPVWTLATFLDLVGGCELSKGLFLIAAALPMLWMRAYWLAVAASIVAMLPTGPSFLAGLPIGIWALSVLSKPEVKAAFAVTKNRLESKAAELGMKTPQRRFSRTAIVGACCVPFAILPLMPPLVLTDPKPLRSSEFFTMMRETTGGFVLTILFALVSLATPFVTTILGMVSITHIRQSAGRLYGMSLALFDALLFPLLVLNSAIFVAFRFIQLSLPQAPASADPSPGVVILLTLIIGGLLDFFLIRWAWRKANTGSESEQKQTGETGTDVKTERKNTNSKGNIGKISLILAIGGVVISIAIALLLALIESLTDFMPPYMLCFVLFVALEIAALVTGIIGWCSACGKAGLITSAILLALAALTIPASDTSMSEGTAGGYTESFETYEEPVVGSDSPEQATREQGSQLTIDGFIQAVESKGMTVGEKVEQFYQLLEATDGYSIEINEERIEVYQFDTTVKSGREAIQKRQTEGVMGQSVIVNSNLMMLVPRKHKDWDEIQDIFLGLK